MAKACFFCQQQKSLTKEHAWPKWILELFRAEKPAATRMRRASTGKPLVDRTYRHKYSDAILVRCVCEECNSGWMADLENEARPVLLRLMRLSASPETVTEIDAEVICRWAMKTTMVFQAVHPVDSFFTPDERREFVDSRQMPVGLLVAVSIAPYLGYHNCQTGEVTAVLRLRHRDDDIERQAPCLVTTTNLAGLVIQVAAFRLPSDVKVFKPGIDGRWNACSRWIRPFSEPFEWSNTALLAMGDAEFMAYMHRWLQHPDKPLDFGD